MNLDDLTDEAITAFRDEDGVDDTTIALCNKVLGHLPQRRSRGPAHQGDPMTTTDHTEVTAESLTDEQINDYQRGGDLKARVLAQRATAVCYTDGQRADRMKHRARIAAEINAQRAQEGR